MAKEKSNVNRNQQSHHGFLKKGVWGGRRRQSRLLPPQIPLCPRPGAGVRGWGKAGLSTLRKPYLTGRLPLTSPNRDDIVAPNMVTRTTTCLMTLNTTNTIRVVGRGCVARKV